MPCRAPLRDVALQTDPSAIEAAVVVHESALIDALATLFDGLWRRALPLPGPSVAGGTTRPRHNPDVDEQRLRALLLSGPTDTAIARQLVAVHRTLQRRVAYADLGAHSRFQIGIQAAIRDQSPGERNY